MNSTNNDFYKNAALKVFAQLGQLIEEDENIKNKIDDKPKQINLLDLNKDILNIIGDFVKKDNKEREERERKDKIKREREEIVNSEQIINGKIIMFRNFCGDYITKPLNTKKIQKIIYLIILIGNFQI